MSNTPPPPPPPGYQAYQSPVATYSSSPADYSQRVIAYIIDVALVIPILIVGALAMTVSEGLGLAVILIGALAYWVYNLLYLQGTTGQSIGKKQQNIKLVRDADGQPVGFGMAFVRYLVASVASNFTCGIYGLLDILWPLWDEQKKRLTDKILKFAVVKT